MVEVEATQEELIGLARARVLGGGQPWDHLGQLARTEDRSDGVGAEADDPLAGGGRLTDPALAFAPDVDLVQLGRRRRDGRSLVGGHRYGGHGVGEHEEG